ncbi:MAG: hypothetical protein QXU98_11860 [Candidatus Parvarchaeota archaeon]
MERRLNSVEEINIHNILDKIYTGINNADMIEIQLKDKSVIELYPYFRKLNSIYPLGKDKIMIEYCNGEQIKLAVKDVKAIILYYFGEGFYDMFKSKEGDE